MVGAPRPAGARGSGRAGQRRLWSQALSGIYRRVAEPPGTAPCFPGATCTPKVNVPLLCLQSIQLIIYAQSCNN